MSNRIFYIDILKVLALFFIVTLHTSAHYVNTYDVANLSEWSIANFYNSLSRAGVPLFFMITI